MGGVLVVVEPPPFEVSSAVPVAVVDVVEPALVLLVLLVLLVVAVPAAAALPSAPQPASAMARLPVKQATRRRPDANPGSPVLSLACIFATPDKQLHTGQARDEVTDRGCTSVQLSVQLA
jgi:hypothetical protein